MNKYTTGTPINYVYTNVTNCEICGEETPYIGTKRCNSCYEMEVGLKFLISRNKETATKWLEYNLKILKGK